MISRILKYVTILCLATLALSAESFVNDFLLLDSDIRSSAMGGSKMACSGPSALFGNPARIGCGGELVFASHEQLYQGLLISDVAGVALDIGGPGKFAIGILYAGGGGIMTTNVPDPSKPVSASNRPFEVAEKSHHDIAVTPGYALSVGENIWFGASTSLIYRHLVDTTAFGGAFSAGIDWAPLHGLAVGASVRDLSYLSWQTGYSELGLPSLALGAQFEHIIGAGFDGSLCIEGQYLPQEVVFEGFAGAEVSYRNIFALRGGLNNGKFTAGADLQLVDGLRVGAAFGFHGDLPLSYRIGATFAPVGGTAE